MPKNLSKNSSYFLIIGCGSIGKRHIGNLIALNSEKIIAFDTKKDRRSEIESRFGVETVDDLKDAWGKRPEVALITVPTSLHVSYALEAADHGCHLFIEKPLSNRMEGVDKLLKKINEQRLISLIGCNMRFHPAIIKIKQLLEKNTIGRVIAARVEFGQYLPDWHPWEDYRFGYSASAKMGGGVILDAIHEIDYIRWMLGEVETVACFAGQLSHLEIETEDTAAILLRFAGGTIGEIHLDYLQRGYSRKCQIIGDEGTIQWDYNAGEVCWHSKENLKWKVFSNPVDWLPNQMYLEEMRHFLRCLTGEEEAAQNGIEATKTLRIALAAKISAQTQKIVKIRE